MVLAAMLAMALVAASPAMANSYAIAGDVDGGFGHNGFGSGFGNDGFGNGDPEFDFADASQGQFAIQVSTGDANVAASDGSVAIVSQDLSVDQSQSNAGLDGDSDDGIFDEFDFVILSGDFDNNGIVDDFEF